MELDQDFRLSMGIEGKKQYHILCGPSDIAPAVIVPGDPGRVEKIVNQLDRAHKVAENRGLVTYTGSYKGWPVSITSTGMGGPSASIVYEELINIGAKVLIRVGSVACLQEDVKEGDIVIPYACVRDDGASHYYVADNFPAVATPEIFQTLINSSIKLNLKYKTGINWSHSCFYNRSSEYFQQWSRKRVISMDMEAAALFVIAYLRNVMAGFVGVCYANRYIQSSGSNVDLSVPDIKRDFIQHSEQQAITIALDSLKDLYERKVLSMDFG
jgi:uridine phosphorylase